MNLYSVVKSEDAKAFGSNVTNMLDIKI